MVKSIIRISQRGDSPFVYRDGTGWPASLPYIRKIRVSMAIGTQPIFTKWYLWSKYGGAKKDQNQTPGKLLIL